jgi:predicted dehydrogenase
MLGYGLMGRAHASAYRSVSHVRHSPPLAPELVAICGRDERALAQAARDYGFAGITTDWRALVADERVELFDNGGPNDVHAEPTTAAARAGKHVLCEKPLGRTAEESYEMWQSVEDAGVMHMCGFNYRFVPAVRLARELIETGELGDVYHYRARYLKETRFDQALPMRWRFSRQVAGSGAVGDFGSHLVDLARYLVGEPASVTAATRTFVAERSGVPVDVEDAFEAILEFESGAIGTIEASRLCSGRKNALGFEINGSKGSLVFDLERLNELGVHFAAGSGARARGFQTVIVSEHDHPFWKHWWPPGHLIGWEHTFVHEVVHLLTAIGEDGEIGPHGATFEDGYRAAEVCDAILRSAKSGRREPVRYKTLAR